MKGAVWGILALGGLVLWLGRKSSGSAGSALQSPPIGPCTYAPGDGLRKSYEELIYRIHERIREVRHDLGMCITSSGTPCTLVLASALATSPNYGVPPDIATALARQESGFRLLLETNRIQQAISKGPCTLAAGTELGPMQVKPGTFCQVGKNPREMLGMSMTGRIWYAVTAGLEYLEWLKKQMPGASWKDILQAYNVGLAGFRRGKRNEPYACAIISRANQYTELKL